MRASMVNTWNFNGFSLLSLSLCYLSFSLFLIIIVRRLNSTNLFHNFPFILLFVALSIRNNSVEFAAVRAYVSFDHCWVFRTAQRATIPMPDYGKQKRIRLWNENEHMNMNRWLYFFIIIFCFIWRTKSSQHSTSLLEKWETHLERMTKIEFRRSLISFQSYSRYPYGLWCMVYIYTRIAYTLCTHVTLTDVCWIRIKSNN